MPPHRFRARRGQHVLDDEEDARRELAAFRTVLAVAREEVRTLARHAGQPVPALAAASAALDDATTVADVVAVEPGLHQVRAELGMPEPVDRRVQIGPDLLSWETLGGSYAGVAAAARRAAAG